LDFVVPISLLLAGVKGDAVLRKIKYCTGAAAVLAGKLRSISFAEDVTAFNPVGGASVAAVACVDTAADTPSSSAA
jgi:hypothetical protein